MLRRITRAAGRRVAEADPEDLEQLLAIRAEVDHAIVEAVRGLRASGYTWEQIGAVMGVTRQAVLMRFNPLLAESPMGDSSPVEAGMSTVVDTARESPPWWKNSPNGERSALA